ncbi:Uncharacterised protein [Mycobacteroides abscessus subsp. abscessus]|nr:Uncharacterised protein [Mycobacteroides abscessus subsp. abscessus]
MAETTSINAERRSTTRVIPSGPSFSSVGPQPPTARAKVPSRSVRYSNAVQTPSTVVNAMTVINSCNRGRLPAMRVSAAAVVGTRTGSGVRTDMVLMTSHPRAMRRVQRVSLRRATRIRPDVRLCRR